jgi:hypothetical protein
MCVALLWQCRWHTCTSDSVNTVPDSYVEEKSTGWVASAVDITAQLKRWHTRWWICPNWTRVTRETLLLDFKSHNNAISANRYCQTLQKLRTKIKNTFHGTISDSIIMRQNTSCPPVAHRIQDQLNAKQWDMLKHPAYSPDLLPCIFYVFELLIKSTQRPYIHVRWWHAGSYTTVV